MEQAPCRWATETASTHSFTLKIHKLNLQRTGVLFKIDLGAEDSEVWAAVIWPNRVVRGYVR